MNLRIEVGMRAFVVCTKRIFARPSAYWAQINTKKRPANMQKRMAELLRKYSADPMKDIAQLFSLMTFNYFIGNCDAHLKNYSIIRNDDWSELSLSPAYDLVSTTAYKGLSTNMGLYIGRKKKLELITRDDFIDMAKGMRIGLRAANALLEDLREQLICALGKTEKETAIAQTIARQTMQRIERSS